MTRVRLVTSFQMQLLEYRQRFLLLAIVLAMPALLFAANYYSVPLERQVPLEVPERGGLTTVYVDSREAWPMVMGIIGISWGVATIAFFSVVGNLQRDRRLLLSGYRAWEILLARAGLLAVLSVPIAIAGMIPYVVVTSSLHPELVWLACFMTALISGGFGLLVGILLPRHTEGLLVIILGTGIGLSLSGDAARYFFLYPASQLLMVGRLARDPWPFPYLASGLIVAAVFAALALALWWWRTRLPRYVEAQPANDLQVNESGRAMAAFASVESRKPAEERTGS